MTVSAPENTLPRSQGLLFVTIIMALAAALWSHRLFALPFVPSFLFTLPIGLCFGLILWRPDIALPLALFVLPLVNIHFDLAVCRITTIITLTSYAWWFDTHYEILLLSNIFLPKKHLLFAKT